MSYDTHSSLSFICFYCLKLQALAECFDTQNLNDQAGKETALHLKYIIHTLLLFYLPEGHLPALTTADALRINHQSNCEHSEPSL